MRKDDTFSKPAEGVSGFEEEARWFHEEILPALWAEFMDELRAVHLGGPAPDGPSATEKLAAAYAAVADS